MNDKPYAGNTIADQSVKYHTLQIIILSLKVEKNPLKNLELFSNFKLKINLNK